MSTLIFNKRPLDLEEEQRNSKRFKRKIPSSSTEYVTLPTLETQPDYKLNKLRVLFPYMTEEIISGVLTNCSQNVEAAIDALNNLNISDSPQRSRQNGRPGGSTLEENKADILTSSNGINSARAAANSEKRLIEERGRQEKLNRIARDYGKGLIDRVQTMQDIGEATNLAQMAFKEFGGQVTMEYGVEKIPVLEDKNESLGEHLSTLIRDFKLLQRAVVVQNNTIKMNQEKVVESDALREENERLKAELQNEKRNNYRLQCYLKMSENGEMDLKNPDIC